MEFPLFKRFFVTYKGIEVFKSILIMTFAFYTSCSDVAFQDDTALKNSSNSAQNSQTDGSDIGENSPDPRPAWEMPINLVRRLQLTSFSTCELPSQDNSFQSLWQIQEDGTEKRLGNLRVGIYIRSLDVEFQGKTSSDVFSYILERLSSGLFLNIELPEKFSTEDELVRLITGDSFELKLNSDEGEKYFKMKSALNDNQRIEFIFFSDVDLDHKFSKDDVIVGTTYLTSVHQKTAQLNAPKIGPSNNFLGDLNEENELDYVSLIRFYGFNHIQSECSTYSNPSVREACERYCRGVTAAVRNSDPLMIDFGGNGFNLTSLSDGVNFDFGANGQMVKTAWVSRNNQLDDAFLVIDINNDYQISNGSEMIGPDTFLVNGLSASNGFSVLEHYDFNNDNVIDGSDEIFNHLSLWFDYNHNGYVDYYLKELIPLKKLVLAINIKPNFVNSYDEEGNRLVIKSEVLLTSGEKRVIGDIWLVSE